MVSKADLARFEREKPGIDRACRTFIDTVLKPRFLPEIRPTEFNYCVDILGKWHGMNYRFIQLFRTDRKDAISPEFEAPFTRLEYVVPDHFQLSYHRHTGQWHCVYRGLTLNDALATIESEEIFRPI